MLEVKSPRFHKGVGRSLHSTSTHSEPTGCCPATRASFPAGPVRSTRPSTTRRRRSTRGLRAPCPPARLAHPHFHVLNTEPCSQPVTEESLAPSWYSGRFRRQVNTPSGARTSRSPPLAHLCLPSTTHSAHTPDPPDPRAPPPTPLSSSPLRSLWTSPLQAMLLSTSMRNPWLSGAACDCHRWPHPHAAPCWARGLFSLLPRRTHAITCHAVPGPFPRPLNTPLSLLLWEIRSLGPVFLPASRAPSGGRAPPALLLSSTPSLQVTEIWFPHR